MCCLGHEGAPPMSSEIPEKPWYRRPGFLHPVILVAGLLLGYCVFDVGPMRVELAAAREKLQGAAEIRQTLLLAQAEEFKEKLDAKDEEIRSLKADWPKGAVILESIRETEIPKEVGWSVTFFNPGFALREISMDPIQPGGDEYPIRAYLGVRRALDSGEPAKLACLTSPTVEHTIKLTPQRREEMMRAAGLWR